MEYYWNKILNKLHRSTHAAHIFGSMSDTYAVTNAFRLTSLPAHRNYIYSEMRNALQSVWEAKKNKCFILENDLRD